MRSIKWRLGVILAAVMVLSVVVAGMSFAIEGQAGASDMKTVCQSFISKLAANLGIDESTLTEALDKTQQEMINEAVQAGTITQEEADRLAAKNKNVFCRGFAFLGGKGDRGIGHNLDQIAGVLGMSVDELKAELDAGKKLEEIAAAKGLTVEQFKEKMKEARQAEIAQAVTDGKITQSQADEMIKRLGQGPGGRGFRGHGPSGQSSNSNNSSSAGQ